MIWRLVAIGFCGALAIGAAPQTKSSYRNATLTGCIDEQPGPQYVLRGPNELKLIAQLEPNGFPVQAFAKYLGKKVSVEGRLASGSEPAVMRVRTIKPLSGACAPAAETRKAPAAAGKPETRTLSGCMDEQAGPKYILIDAESREPRAELEPAGFEPQLFARFLGHSVSVRGELVPDRNPPLLRVKQLGDVKDVADHCGPR